MAIFIASATVALIGSSPIVALLNPIGSGKTLSLQSVEFVGSNIPSLSLERYNVVMTTALLPGMTPPPVYCFDTPGASAVALVKTRVDHTLTEPSDSNIDFAARLYNGQTDTKVTIGGAVSIPAGASLAIDTAAFSGSPGDVTFILVWSES